MKIMIDCVARIAEAGYVSAALPDYCSFDFTGGPRGVTPVFAAALAARVGGRVTKVGVFAGWPVQKIADVYKKGVIQAVRLDGNEDDAYIERLRGYIDAPVIKTVRMGRRPAAVSAKADFLMLDFGAALPGPADVASIRKPWFLAGNVALANLGDAMALGAYCVCVREGVETNGFKDWEKIAAVMESARKAGFSEAP